VIRNLPISYLN